MGIKKIVSGLEWQAWTDEWDLWVPFLFLWNLSNIQKKKDEAIPFPNDRVKRVQN